MALTTPSQRKALRGVVSLTQRGLVTEDDIAEFEGLYTQLWNGHGISVGQACFFDPWVRATDISPEWIAEHERLRDQDPASRVLASSPEGTPFSPSQTWDEAAKRSEIYRAFRRHGFADSIVQRYSAPALGDMFSLVLRPRGGKLFDDQDVAVARLLHTHVGGALATRMAIRALGIAGAAAPSFHAFVSFPRLTVTMEARAWSGWRRVLGGPIGARGKQRVERLIARVALDFHSGKVRTRRVLPMLRAEAAWVPAQRDESLRALVLFFDEKARAAIHLNAPAAELLSPMQRRVAELAARGATNVEIGAAMQITIETVRTHMKEVMRRLGVERRTELVAFTEPSR